MKKIRLIPVGLMILGFGSAFALPNPSQNDTESVSIDSVNIEALNDTLINQEAETAEKEAVVDTDSSETGSSDKYTLIIAIILFIINFSALIYMYKAMQKGLVKKEEGRETNPKSSMIERMDVEVKGLLDEVSILKTHITRVNQEVEAIQSALVILNSNSNQASKKKSQPKTEPDIMPSKPKEEVFYSSNISVAGDGSLTIPMSVLSETDNGQLFKISFNPSSCIGSYTLNPSCTTIYDSIDKLTIFSVGLEVMNSDMSVEVMAPGKLSEKDGQLVIDEKLHLRCV